MCRAERIPSGLTKAMFAWERLSLFPPDVNSLTNDCSSTFSWQYCKGSFGFEFQPDKIFPTILDHSWLDSRTKHIRDGPEDYNCLAWQSKLSFPVRLLGSLSVTTWYAWKLALNLSWSHFKAEMDIHTCWCRPCCQHSHTSQNLWTYNSALGKWHILHQQLFLLH